MYGPPRCCLCDEASCARACTLGDPALPLHLVPMARHGMRWTSTDYRGGMPWAQLLRVCSTICADCQCARFEINFSDRQERVMYQVVGYYVTRECAIVGFFDVAARLCTGDRPIAELVGTARSFLHPSYFAVFHSV